MSRVDRLAAKAAAEKAAADRLAVAVGDRSWTLQARCREADPALFSPVDGRGRLDVEEAAQTVEVFCRRCPVLGECRAEARALSEAGSEPQELLQGGVWFPVRLASGPRREPVDLLAAGEVAA